VKTKERSPVAASVTSRAPTSALTTRLFAENPTMTLVEASATTIRLNIARILEEITYATNLNAARVPGSASTSQRSTV